MESHGMMIVKWMGKKPVSVISIFHSDIMVTVTKKRKGNLKIQLLWSIIRLMDGVEKWKKKIAVISCEGKEAQVIHEVK